MEMTWRHCLTSKFELFPMPGYVSSWPCESRSGQVSPSITSERDNLVRPKDRVRLEGGTDLFF